MPNLPAPPPPAAVDLLAQLLKDGFRPERLDELHDFLRLLGVVIGQVTLLSVATSPTAEAAPRVSAAKALLDIKETPETLAERIRRSPFSGLTLADLEAMITRIRNGDVDPHSLIQKESPDEQPA